MKKTFLRKITATFLAMVMAVIILPFQAAADPGGDGWAFDSSTGKLTITTNAGTTAWRDSILDKSTVLNVEIQSTVTSIGDGAFFECTSLNTVAFSETSQLKSIGGYAFYGCTNLSSITIPDSVTSIDSAAFYGCSKLESITIPSSVESIGNYAFYGCTSLNTVTFTGTSQLTSIGGYAFYGCSKLESITIPSSVESIGNYAFDDCESLASFNVSPENTNFSSGSKNELMSKDKTTLIRYPSGRTENSYAVPDGVTSIDNDAFYVCTALTSITIPDSVTSIGDGAFFECTSLNTVAFYETSQLKSIGDYAFYGCTNLSSITIPDSVTSIGNYAFAYCSSLESITIPDSVTTIGDGAFYYCEILSTVTFTGTSQLTSIGFWAFGYCENLESITIPSSVTSIGNSAFNGCSSLERITIPDSVASIGDYAFAYCVKLESITIPDSVTSIGEGAFYYCEILKSVTIPSSVTSINSAAFYGCTSLKEVEFLGATPPTTIGDDLFIDVPVGLKIYVPNGTIDNYTAKLAGSPPVNYEIIAREKPVIPAPQPSTGGGYTTPQPSVSGGTGWTAVNKSISTATDGSAVAINMNGATDLPKIVLDAVKGKNVNLVITMSNGFVWTINGKDIIDAKNIDLTVKKPLTQRIPTDILNTVTGEKYQLYLGFEGDFGFKAVLTVPLGSTNSGRYANLFYFNSATKKLEYISSGKIGTDGKAGLDFTHASDYVITITNEISKDIKSDNSETDTSSEANPTTGDGAVMIQVISLALIFTSSLFINKKLRRNHQ